MTTKERLKKFVEKEGYGQNSFEKKVGIANGYLASKSNSITSDTIEKVLAMFPNLSLNWLFTGEGEMLIENQSNKTEQSKINTEDLSVSDLVRALDNISESVKLNAIANERNSRNMEKMLEMLSEKDTASIGKKDFVRTRPPSEEDVAQIA